MQLSGDAFSEVVRQALEGIPEGFRPYLEGVAVDVEDEPEEQVWRSLGLAGPRNLFGLYRGTPLTRRHVAAPYRYPDRIVIYQRNIERVCRSRPSMIRRIRQTVLHEVGHHFGLSEQQLRELGYG
jgi:predicted Zn-dependent protease with MMP-like domain